MERRVRKRAKPGEVMWTKSGAVPEEKEEEEEEEEDGEGGAFPRFAPAGG